MLNTCHLEQTGVARIREDLHGESRLRMYRKNLQKLVIKNNNVHYLQLTPLRPRATFSPKCYLDSSTCI